MATAKPAPGRRRRQGARRVPLVGVLMGSTSDLESVTSGLSVLEELGIAHEVRVLSAHRTPEALRAYAAGARSRGIAVLIAAAGGAAHLAGVVASHTPLPVIGIPMETKGLGGLDSLLSTVQMPAGIPVATMAVGKSGAVNAALFAAQILALSRPPLARALDAYRRRQTDRVLAVGDPRSPPRA
jgi:5-(carboxyamino)imidazole ribonucleotide mutase